jgi:uroporphyrinogen-III synthase
LGDEDGMGTQGGIGAAIDPPRYGMRALVTRPRAEAALLAEALAARGMAALLEPLLDIHFRDPGNPPDLAGAQAVLCTSANGVRAFARLSTERALPVFAVGEATAARTRAEGFFDVHSAGGAVGDLVALVSGCLRPDAGRLLHIAGSLVAGDLAGELRARGFTVERAVLYEARPVATLSAATVRALAAGIVDVALFFSPRTAAIFARLADQAGIVEATRHIAAISISAAADAALDTLRFRARLIAARPDQPALLAVLDRLIEERRRA